MTSQDNDADATQSNADEVLQLLRRRGIPSPMAKTLNFHLNAAEYGRVVFSGTPLEDHVNAGGGIHGGWYGSILDSAMTCSLLTHIPEDQAYATLDYGVRMTRAIPVGTEVSAKELRNTSVEERLWRAGRYVTKQDGSMRRARRLV